MQVSLPDELLLLALHDEKGSVIPAAAAPLAGALVGAMLMELVLLGRLQETPYGTVFADRTPTGDPILDEVLTRIADADEPRSASYWVGRLAGTMPRLKDRMLDGLVTRGILERRERRILWIFPSRSFPLADAAAEQQARDRVRAVILDGQTPDRRTAALIGLVRACNLIDEIFAPHERPQAYRRIAELTSEEAAREGWLGSGLEAVLMASLLGSTLLYAHHVMNRPDEYDSDWSFSPGSSNWSSDSDTWDTNWSEPSSASDTSSWDGPSSSSSDSGSSDSGGWGGSDSGGSSDSGGGGGGDSGGGGGGGD
jgi:Golgi phosphoprotein 3